MHMLVAKDNTRLSSLHGYKTREETRMAVKDVKALFFPEKWPKFFSLIKVQNSAVGNEENP